MVAGGMEGGKECFGIILVVVGQFGRVGQVGQRVRGAHKCRSSLRLLCSRPADLSGLSSFQSLKLSEVSCGGSLVR
jgi:hypothetical protein